MGAGHCQWGGLTDRDTFRSLGPSAVAGGVDTHGRKES